MDLRRCAINSITVRSLPLPDLIDAVTRRGIPGIAPWRDLIEPYGAAVAGRMIRDAGLSVSSLCRGGMFTAPNAGSRREAIEDNRRAIDEAYELDAGVLVLVCGPVVGRDPAGSRAMIRDGIEEILPYAREAGVRLGVEPLHPMMAADRSAVTSLREAVDLRTAIGDPALGVIVDVYHVWWEDDLAGQIARAAGHILGFHVSDWVTPIEGQLSSRGMIGDGCIDITGVAEQVFAHGYEGFVEVEILSDHWWRQNPEHTLDVIRDRLQDV
jgi:sugar phosphate isomerase/epimerase